jgi:hypothetical protein
MSADGNRNGIVDAADYVVWRKNSGGIGAAATSSVPAAQATSQNAPAIPTDSNSVAIVVAATPLVIRAEEVASASPIVFATTTSQNSVLSLAALTSGAGPTAIAKTPSVGGVEASHEPTLATQNFARPSFFPPYAIGNSVRHVLQGLRVVAVGAADRVFGQWNRASTNDVVEKLPPRRSEFQSTTIAEILAGRVAKDETPDSDAIDASFDNLPDKPFRSIQIFSSLAEDGRHADRV